MVLRYDSRCNIRITFIDVEPKNRNRVMRLLEKLHAGDDHVPHNAPRYDCLKLGVTWDRETLRRRIDERLQRRLDAGMIGTLSARMRPPGRTISKTSS